MIGGGVDTPFLLAIPFKRADNAIMATSINTYRTCVTSTSINGNMNHIFKFDKNTAIEAVLYLSAEVDQPTLHKIFKLMYFADKHHLQEYGRLIFGDRYIAMRHGPVPSSMYDLAKIARGEKIDTIGFANEFIDAVTIDNGYNIKSLRSANTDMFSQSEIDSMNYAIQKYGNKSFAQLTDISHDASWEAADENDLIDINALTIGLKDREALLEHLNNPLP